MDIKEILAQHALWTNDTSTGAKADLSEADLSGANLSGANLSGADLREADLSGANLSGADLSGANLSGADLREADLSGANLSGADLSDVNLRGADLSGADLRGANLNDANLRGANLIGANLNDAYLRCADLRGADLSGAIGIMSAAEWLKAFEHDDQGVIVFKAIGGTTFQSPKIWRIEEGATLTEACNSNRTDLCGCGVNFGTLEFVRSFYPETTIWRCQIAWIDLADVCVPYNTDGKARCARLTLLSQLGSTKT